MAKRDPKTGRFQPGESGNPDGRPAGAISLTTVLREALAERDVKGKRTKARAIIDCLVEAACDGEAKVNLRAIQQIFDRIDGLLTTTEQGPMVDLETIAREMKAKRDKLRGAEPAGGDP
ncbi:MAG: DUF5681 domain-containing protein [Capsulimonadaceae bacterium]